MAGKVRDPDSLIQMDMEDRDGTDSRHGMLRLWRIMILMEMMLVMVWRVVDMEVNKVANEVADMEVDKVAYPGE